MKHDTHTALLALGFLEDDADTLNQRTQYVHPEMRCLVNLENTARPDEIVSALIKFGESKHRAAVREAREKLLAL